MASSVFFVLLVAILLRLFSFLPLSLSFIQFLSLSLSGSILLPLSLFLHFLTECFTLRLTFSLSAFSRFLPNIYPLPFSLYVRLSLFFCFSHCLFFSLSPTFFFYPYILSFFLLLFPSFIFSITLDLFFSVLLFSFFRFLYFFLSIFLFLVHCHSFSSLLLSLPYVFFFSRFNFTFFSSPFLSILQWHTYAFSLSLAQHFFSHDYRRELNKEKKEIALS